MNLKNFTVGGKKKKPNTKCHMMYDSIYMTLQNRLSTETEALPIALFVRLVLATLWHIEFRPGIRS